MQSDASRRLDSNSEPDMLARLRAATGRAHQRLDAAFSSLELARQDGLTRFLAAHAIAMAPLDSAFRDFVEDTLALPCPDYPAMLRADLAALGVDAGALPGLAPSPDLTGEGATAGIGYVLCGSRLGMAVIRREGYWGSDRGFRSAYMEDEQGHLCWKALVPWLRAARPAPATRDALLAGALATFELFAQAFAVSRDALPALAVAAEQPAHG